MKLPERAAGRGASGRQVCVQGRNAASHPKICSPGGSQGPGEPRRLQVRSGIYLHKRLQGMAAVELWTLRHTDKERPVFDNQRLPPPPTSSLSGAILNPFPSIKQKPGYPVSLTAMVTAGGTNKAHIERLYTKPVWFPYHYFNNRRWPCRAGSSRLSAPCQHSRLVRRLEALSTHGPWNSDHVTS